MTILPPGTARLTALFLTVLFLGACNVTKNFQKHEYLLVKNKFTVDNKKISTDDLEGYMQQHYIHKMEEF